MERRGFLKFLGLGAAGTAASQIVPQQTSLVGEEELKSENARLRKENEKLTALTEPVSTDCRKGSLRWQDYPHNTFIGSGVLPFACSGSYLQPRDTYSQFKKCSYCFTAVDTVKYDSCQNCGNSDLIGI